MLRENLYNLMPKGDKVLVVPKNSGLKYIYTVMAAAGVEPGLVEQLRSGSDGVKDGDLEFRLARGEDIAQQVKDYNSSGRLAFGLTGDDLFDEFQFRSARKAPDGVNLAVVNTYDWFDPEAKYSRPALSFINKSGRMDDVPQNARVAVNAKYELTSQRYLENRLRSRGIDYTLTLYSGTTEDNISKGFVDCAVEIVYTGRSLSRLGLNVVEPVRFSDVVLIGPEEPRNPWEVEYKILLARKASPREGSLTTLMFRDQNGWVKKFGSESAEFLAARMTGENITGEYCDVTYAMMVALAAKDTPWKDVERVLMQRWKNK